MILSTLPPFGGLPLIEYAKFDDSWCAQFFMFLISGEPSLTPPPRFYPHIERTLEAVRTAYENQDPDPFFEALRSLATIKPEVRYLFDLLVTEFCKKTPLSTAEVACACYEQVKPFPLARLTLAERTLTKLRNPRLADSFLQDFRGRADFWQARLKYLKNHFPSFRREVIEVLSLVDTSVDGDALRGSIPDLKLGNGTLGQKER